MGESLAKTMSTTSHTWGIKNVGNL